jgi:hypothetical protein
MTVNHSVLAVFAPPSTPPTRTPSSGETALLAIQKGGSGFGRVTSAPAGINCGSTCTASFARGTMVTLTATPLAGSTFAGWLGACTGQDVCVVSLDHYTSVAAIFNQE